MHLVTSGCSYTQAGQYRWPAFLSQSLDVTLHNRGQSGVSNNWIARTAIYQTELLLKNNINAADIMVAAMWTSFDRISLYTESNLAKTLTFIDSHPNINQISEDMKPGYSEGSLDVSSCFIGKDSERFILNKFFPSRLRAIQSYENILRLQWYCHSKKIRLINLSICDIFRYPNYRFLDVNKTGPYTKETYEDVLHLHDLIDFDNWIFYQKSDGMYEYSAKHNLDFEEDGHHPTQESHKIYVKNFLMPQLKEKGII